MGIVFVVSGIVVVICILAFASQNWRSGRGWISIFVVVILAVGPVGLAWRFLPNDPIRSIQYTAFRPAVPPVDDDGRVDGETEATDKGFLRALLNAKSEELKDANELRAQQAADLAELKQERDYLRTELDQFHSATNNGLAVIRELQSKLSRKQDEMQRQLANVTRKTGRDRLKEYSSSAAAPTVVQQLSDGWVACETQYWQPCQQQVIVSRQPIAQQELECYKPVIGQEICSPPTMIVVEAPPMCFAY
jgi:hypothetical protein